MINSPIPAIEAKDVSHRYQSGKNTITIINHLNLVIQLGECVSITGHSGSGKTTLLSLLAALDTPTQGEIFINNINICKMTEEQRARVRAKNIGFIFQHFHLLPYLSAIDNITLPLELMGRKDSRPIALDWLEKTNLLDRKDHLPNQLSGGEMQRVAIARAFALDPKLLFADEPTGNLDNKTASSIMDLLFELNATHNATLIIVTHNLSLAERCQTTYSLINGQLK